MSLHARCPQRIAGISTHRTLRRWRGARCYASYTTKEPEWFQKKRGTLLARKPHHHHELLDVTDFSELRATLEGFEPEFDYGSTAPVRLQRVHLSSLLTRFNIRVGTSQLFADGTDPLHSPGKPWPRRMWGGGAVRVNPHLDLESETPFLLKQMVSCVERIKDVRLLGSDDESKIVVTVERSYSPHGTSRDVTKIKKEDEMQTQTALEENTPKDWSNAWVKEERNLVFLKAKTAAELTSIHAGELLAPKYIKAPVEPDFTHSLTPTRTFLFRYSAITYNAHLLHLDPTYARNIEGHRNLLVHGPLTLTLMLQSAKKHFQTLKFEDSNQRVESIEYRNLAPLYCDEEMRICVKEKRRTDTGSVWDVWIEGPTGGMAVKALVRSARKPLQRKATPPSSSAAPLTYLYYGKCPLRAGIRVNSKRDAPAMRGCPLPYLYTSGSPLMAWIQSQVPFKPEPTATDERSKPRQTAISKLPRPPTNLTDQPAKTSPKLAATNSPPNPPPISTSQPAKTPFEPTNPPKQPYKVNPRNLNVRRYSRRWLKRRVGQGLRYLYFTHASPLFNANTVARSPSSEQEENTSSTPTHSLRGQNSRRSVAPARRLTLAQRQRAVLLSQPRPLIRKVGSTVAGEVLPGNEADAQGSMHSPASGEGEAEAGASVAKQSKQRTPRRRLKIRKMVGTVIRKTDMNLKETAVRRYHAHRNLVLPPVREG